MFKKYIEYLKDNPKGYWFKRKLYGWGWTPVKWQGWAVILGAVAVIIWNGINFAKAVKAGGSQNPTDAMLIWFFIRTAVIVAVLIMICYKKGEKPRWQWGIPKKDNDTLK